MQIRTLLRFAVGLVILMLFGSIPTESANAQDPIFSQGKWIVKCAEDSGQNPRDIKVLVDGSFVAKCSELTIQRKIKGLGFPQIFSVKGNGALRAALPPPGRFGGTFYATGYWDCNPAVGDGGFVQNMFITKLNLSLDPANPKILKMTGKASNSNSINAKKFTLRVSGSTTQTKVAVSYTLIATRNFCVDQTRQSQAEGFRVARIASNFLSDSIHDSDQARYKNTLNTIICASLQNQEGFILTNPLTLGEPEVFLIHTDTSPRNTPTLLLTMTQPHYSQFTPQGYVSASSDPDDDNIDLWANWGSAKSSYVQGESIGQFSYDLTAVSSGTMQCD